MSKLQAEYREVTLEAPAARLTGDLTHVPGSHGIVIFAHGSGSGRFSPRNRAVAEMLHAAGLSTLLLDLLTEPEQQIDEITREHRFNIELLAQRVVAAVDAMPALGDVAELAVGVFGASTGAAAALAAAARRPERVGAVVSRGGRGDLAGDELPAVRAPVLLIVGQRDPEVIRLNRQVQAMLRCPNELVIIERASHLFEEPGTLEQAAHHTARWFTLHLGGPAEQ